MYITLNLLLYLLSEANKEIVQLNQTIIQKDSKMAEYQNNFKIISCPNFLLLSLFF